MLLLRGPLTLLPALPVYFHILSYAQGKKYKGKLDEEQTFKKNVGYLIRNKGMLRGIVDYTPKSTISQLKNRVTSHYYHVPLKTKNSVMKEQRKCSTPIETDPSPPPRAPALWRRPGWIPTLQQLVDVFHGHLALAAGQCLKLIHQLFQSLHQGGLIPNHSHELASWDPKVCHACSVMDLKTMGQRKVENEQRQKCNLIHKAPSSMIRITT